MSYSTSTSYQANMKIIHQLSTMLKNLVKW